MKPATFSQSAVVYTRDEVVPLDDDDWRCLPVPPDDSGDWMVFDDSKDNKTGWVRRAEWGHA